MSAGHAPLAPSFAPVWGHCSAAILASANAPNIETDESREGTAAHWVFSEVMTTHVDGRSERLPLTCAGYIGQTAPNGVVIDDKMVEGAQTIVDDVLAVLAKHKGDQVEVLIEHRVTMAPIHAQNWGTLDCAVIVRDQSGVTIIYLWDYKHGHREVRAEGNLQLIDYMQGLRYKYGIGGDKDQEITVVMRIVHPFSYSNHGPIDAWMGKLSDLRGYANLLHNKANEAFTNPKMTTGLHCLDCPGRLPCSARRRATYNLIDLVNEPYEMDTMSGADLAIERGIIKDGVAVAQKRLDAIEDELAHRISNGETGTGLALESSQGRLAWTVPPEQANALANQFGFDISKFEVKTPTQAKQAAPSGVKAMFSQVLGTVAKRPVGKLKLVNADDTIAARAFKPRR